MAETPSPSPYAPGIISEEQAPPRPAGRASVLIMATFAMTLVSSTALWFPWARRSMLVSGRRSVLELAISAAPLSGALILVWAYLSDRVAVWGTRREGYLLLSGLTMAVTWVVLAFLGLRDVAWLVAAVEFGVATSVTRAAVAGGLAEIGQRRAITGRLAAANVTAARAAALVASLTILFGIESFPLVAGIAAGLSLAVVVLIVTLTDQGPRPVPAAVSPVTIPQFLRSRSFWSSAAFLTIAGLATMPRAIIASRLATPVVFGRLQWVESVATIAGALGYMFVCGRLSLRNVLRIGLIADALVLIAFERTLRAGAPGGLDVGATALAVCDGVIIAALFDLVLRAAPRGREAFGTILLGGFPVFAGLLVSTLAGVLELSPGAVTWFAASAAIAGAFAVSLLPSALVGTRDGERPPS